jgi:hypothetical protein
VRTESGAAVPSDFMVSAPQFFALTRSPEALNAVFGVAGYGAASIFVVWRTP